MTTTWLLLGGNVGNTRGVLSEAAQLLAAKAGHISLQSHVYRTAPWGLEAEQDFLNQVVELETQLQPHELLQTILSIETTLGRLRHEGPRFQSRVIDIDILLYGDVVLHSADLVIPHPGLAERRFALAPLAEVAPKLVHPELQRTIMQLLADCTDNSAVERLKNAADAT